MTGKVQSSKGRKMRIAMVSDFFYPNVGGVEGHMYALSQRLLELGHKVIVITHGYGQHRYGIRYLSSGLKVYHVAFQVIARQDTLPQFFAFFPILRSILIRESIELIHAHQALSSMGLEALLHGRTMGLHTVFTDHSLFGFADTASVLTNKLLQFFLADVDNVICVSHTAKENTVLRANIKDPGQVFVVPNAILSEHFSPKANSKSVSGSELIGLCRIVRIELMQGEPHPVIFEDAAEKRRVTIVVLSRLMYRKGIDLLLGSIPRLCAMYPEIDFVIGGDGPKRVELEQMRERHGLYDRVELCGAIRQGSVREHLIRGDIFLNTSLTEAFGTGIVEAASCGLFVVSTKVGGIPEVLPPDMIRLARPEEDDIVKVMRDAIELVRAGKHDPHVQHQAMARMYSWTDVAERVEHVYREASLRSKSSLLERLSKYRTVGPVAGYIFCIIAVVDVLFLHLLQLLYPRDDVETAEDGSEVVRDPTL